MKIQAMVVWCLIASAGPCFAEAQTQGAFEGAYVSFGVARTATNISKSNVTTVDEVDTYDQPDANGHNLLAEFHAGYGYDIGHKFHTSINVYYRLGTARVQDTIATVFKDTVEQTLTNQIGLYVAPGYYVTDSTLFFAKFGLSKAQQTYQRANPGALFELLMDGEINLDEWVTAKSFGLGIEHKLSQSSFIVMDYTKDIFPNKRIGENVTLNIFKVNIRSQIDQETVSLRLGYMF